MKRTFFALLAIGLLLSACGTPAATVDPTSTPLPPPTETATVTPPPPGPFDYDASVPFDTKVASETQRDGAIVVDLTFATHDPSFSTTTGGRTVAYLVKPQGAGPFAGVVFMHWLGPVSGNRNEYLEEAVALAAHGVVSLVPQGFFPWMSTPVGAESDHPLMVGQVIELRRMIDFLASQPEVDPNRLAYVGHDYGAVYGGVLAGIDHRLKTLILVAGTPSFVDWGRLFQIKAEIYAPIVQDLDPTNYLPDAAPASLLFQFGQQDGVVPADKANAFYAAASDPKKLEWYADIHDMKSADARQARLDWLTAKLALTTP